MNGKESLIIPLTADFYSIHNTVLIIHHYAYCCFIVPCQIGFSVEIYAFFTVYVQKILLNLGNFPKKENPVNHIYRVYHQYQYNIKDYYSALVADGAGPLPLTEPKY